MEKYSIVSGYYEWNVVNESGELVYVIPDGIIDNVFAHCPKPTYDDFYVEISEFIECNIPESFQSIMSPDINKRFMGDTLKLAEDISMGLYEYYSDEE